jgi:hypothetical protein
LSPAELAIEWPKEAAQPGRAGIPVPHCGILATFQSPVQHGTGKSREPADKNVCATFKANGKSVRFSLPPIATRYTPKLMMQIQLRHKYTAGETSGDNK